MIPPGRNTRTRMGPDGDGGGAAHDAVGPLPDRVMGSGTVEAAGRTLAGVRMTRPHGMIRGTGVPAVRALLTSDRSDAARARTAATWRVPGADRSDNDNRRHPAQAAPGEDRWRAGGRIGPGAGARREMS